MRPMLARLALWTIVLSGSGCNMVMDQERQREAAEDARRLEERTDRRNAREEERKRESANAQRAAQVNDQEVEAQRVQEQSLAIVAEEAEKEHAQALKEAAERRAELEAACAPSRAARERAFRAAVANYRRQRERDLAAIEWAKKHCKVEDTRGILISREHVKEGVIIRARPVGDENDLSCDTKAGRPTCLSMAWLATQTDEGLDAVPVYDGAYRTKNEECEKVDVTAGLDLSWTKLDAVRSAADRPVE